MQTSQFIYVPGMSLAVGVNAADVIDAGREPPRRGVRIVILSADAPEWAMVAIKPPAAPGAGASH